MSYLLTIANEKGGVGKTTAAKSIAGNFANDGSRVLLIDLDPSCSLSIQMASENSFSSLNLFTRQYQDISDLIEKKINTVDFIKSDRRLFKLEKKLYSKNKTRVSILKKTLSQIKNDYDYIILDTASTSDAIMLNALIASDLVIIPFNLEYSVLFGLENIISTIKKLNTSFSHKIAYMLLNNLYDRNADEGGHLLAEVSELFRDRLFTSRIDYDANVIRDNNQGSDIKAIELYSSLCAEIKIKLPQKGEL